MSAQTSKCRPNCTLGPTRWAPINCCCAICIIVAASRRRTRQSRCKFAPARMRNCRPRRPAFGANWCHSHTGGERANPMPTGYCYCQARAAPTTRSSAGPSCTIINISHDRLSQSACCCGWCCCCYCCCRCYCRVHSSEATCAASLAQVAPRLALQTDPDVWPSGVPGCCCIIATDASASRARRSSSRRTLFQLNLNLAASCAGHTSLALLTIVSCSGPSVVCLRWD